MQLAHLPTAPVEWALHSILDTFMAIWYDKIDSPQSTIFQVGEQFFPGKLILTVCNPGTQDLPDPVIPDARNHEECFVGVLNSIPDFEIWGIHEKIRVIRIKGSLHELLYFRIEFMTDFRDLRCWYLVDTKMRDYPLDISGRYSLEVRFNDRIYKRFLGPGVLFENLGLEGNFPQLRFLKVELAKPGLKRPLPIAIPMCSPGTCSRVSQCTGLLRYPPSSHRSETMWWVPASPSHYR